LRGENLDDLEKQTIKEAVGAGLWLVIGQWGLKIESVNFDGRTTLPSLLRQNALKPGEVEFSTTIYDLGFPQIGIGDKISGFCAANCQVKMKSTKEVIGLFEMHCRQYSEKMHTFWLCGAPTLTQNPEEIAAAWLKQVWEAAK